MSNIGIRCITKINTLLAQIRERKHINLIDHHLLLIRDTVPAEEILKIE